MKSPKVLVALIAISFLAATSSFAGDKDAPVSKQAGCCAKAEAKGETCGHSCCVAAAKEGKNCETCKGSGKIEKKPEKKS